MKGLFVLLMLCSLSISAKDASIPDSPRSMNEVREELSGLNTAITALYEELLSTDSEASGDILIAFSITPEGDVTLAEVTCSEGLETLHDAVLEEVEAMAFLPVPGRRGDLPVSVPVRLLPPQ
ncbi:MAG: energy transducer TonB [Desulfobacterales bacterium]|nr:energy transducer TonB [Desulfobacterales bacterium]